MKFAVLIVGVIGLTIFIYSIHKICSWKLIMKLGVVINLIIYSLLIFMIIDKGGISFIRKVEFHSIFLDRKCNIYSYDKDIASKG